jgi:hypothetical protein
VQVAAKFIAQKHIRVFGLESAANENMCRLARTDACCGCLDSRNAGAFLAHEGARGAGDLVHDRDVASEQVGKLCEEKRRAKLGRQLLVEQNVTVGAAFGSGQNAGIHRLVPLATTSGHHHVHSRAERVVALDAGVIERQPGSVGSEALPSFHLALVAALGDLKAPVDLGEGVHDVGRIAPGIDNGFGPLSRQFAPMRVGAFAQRRNEADAGDDDVVGVHVRPFWLRRSVRRRSGSGFRRDEAVDLGAKVLHQEVLVRRGLPVIDVLRPFLERHLDAEFLVDRKDDVEEVETVYAEVVDGVAVGRDRVAVNLARFGDDVCDFVECR